MCRVPSVLCHSRPSFYGATVKKCHATLNLNTLAMSLSLLSLPSVFFVLDTAMSPRVGQRRTRAPAVCSAFSPMPLPPTFATGVRRGTTDARPGQPRGLASPLYSSTYAGAAPTTLRKSHRSLQTGVPLLHSLLLSPSLPSHGCSLSLFPSLLLCTYTLNVMCMCQSIPLSGNIKRRDKRSPRLSFQRKRVVCALARHAHFYMNVVAATGDASPVTDRSSPPSRSDKRQGERSSQLEIRGSVRPARHLLPSQDGDAHHRDPERFTFASWAWPRWYSQ